MEPDRNHMLMLSEVSADVSGRRSHRRRKHPRAGVDWPVTVLTDKATYHGKTVNISRGGALIHLTHALDLGDHVRLAIEIPECQDAILAKAEIVRVFPLKRGIEHQFTHAIALKFIEITEENLKFFSGNLSSEWKEDFSELDRYPQTELPQQTKSPKSSENHTHYAFWILVVILLIPICYIAFFLAEQKADNQLMADQLEKRLMIIEEQIESINDSNDSLEQLAEDINNLGLELSSLKVDIPATETLEIISLELKHQSQLVQLIFDKVEINQKPSLADSNGDLQKDEDQYYVVQKGDNLYQISLKNGITINQLRILNSLDEDDSIIAGQKLMIK